MVREGSLGVAFGVVLTLSTGAAVASGYATVRPLVSLLGFGLAVTGITIERGLESLEGSGRPGQFVLIFVGSLVAYVTVDGRVAGAVALLLGLGLGALVAFGLLAKGSRVPPRLGYVGGLVGAVLVLVGLGISFELLVTQSEPVGLGTALSVPARITIPGVLLVVAGFGFVRWSMGSYRSSS